MTIKKLLKHSILNSIYIKNSIILLFIILFFLVIYKIFKYSFNKNIIERFENDIIEPFIYQNIMGGIGNQLFQIYNIISYSIDNNKTYYFNNTTNDGRGLYWDNLLKNIKKYAVNQEQITSKPNITNLNEPSFSFTPFPINIDGNIIIQNSYVQSEKYFKHNFSKITNILGINILRHEIFNKYYLPIKNKYPNIPITSLHFRFGDYINLQNMHYVQPVSYFINAIKYLLDTDSNLTTYLYFGEESDIDKINSYLTEISDTIKNYNYNKNLTFVNYKDIINVKIEDWEELLLMSCCDNHIIANSTFSWWAAYLNPNLNKIVCYPSIHFGYDGQQHSINDLYPPEWTKIHSLSNITCVTGYWYIKNKHGDAFDNWFQNTLKINAPYVIFANKQTINKFKEIRQNIATRYIEYNLNDFYTNKFNLENEVHPIHVPSKELGLIWLEKLNLIKKAAELNYYDTDWYAWIDAGICTFRDKAPPNKIWFPYIVETKLDKEKINYCSSNNGAPPDNLNNSWNDFHTISGGVIIIHKFKIAFFAELFYKTLEKCIQNTKTFVCYSDQIILTKILLENPAYFHKVCDGYGCGLEYLY